MMNPHTLFRKLSKSLSGSIARKTAQTKGGEATWIAKGAGTDKRRQGPGRIEFLATHSVAAGDANSAEDCYTWCLFTRGLTPRSTDMGVT